MDDENFSTSEFVYPNREFRVHFVGGPYDDRDGTLPFLPAFLSLHEMDNFNGRDPKSGKLIVDFRLSEYVYMLAVRNEQAADEQHDYLFRLRVDVDDYFRVR